MNSNLKIQADSWVKDYADYLFHYANQRVNNPDLANDLVQDTFLSALENNEKFDGRSSELTWLRAILKNKIVDQYRKQSSGLNKILVDTPAHRDESNDFFDENGIWKDSYAPQDFYHTKDEQNNTTEFYKILEFCLKKLPELWSSVFSLKYIDEEETTAICETMRISNSNYWVILHRAKLNLRDCFQKNWL